MRRYLLEETYELFDAVRGGDLGELREELGDVVVQVLFRARIAEVAPGAFSIDDVADALVRSSATACLQCWPGFPSPWRTSSRSGRT